MSVASRLGIVVASLLGAGGVAAAAAGSHAADASILGPLALIALTQAPVVLALSLHGGINALVRLATLVIALGAVLFCADLAVRHVSGSGLFPMSAPIGGGTIIVGWLLLAVSALLPARAT